MTSSSSALATSSAVTHFTKQLAHSFIRILPLLPALHFRCYDEDTASDDLIGQCRFSIIPYLSEFEAMEIWVQLISSKNKPAGEVRLGVQFFPAGHLHVWVDRGRKLADTDLVGKQDPYVVLTMDGEMRSFRRQTQICTDGGVDPIFDEHFDFDIVDHYALEVCMHAAALSLLQGVRTP